MRRLRRWAISSSSWRLRIQPLPTRPRRSATIQPARPKSRTTSRECKPPDAIHRGRFSAEDGSAKGAAIRETIEETAIPAGLASPPRPEHCLDIQAALAAGQEFDE